jgi:hypothetical protein
MLEHKDLYNYTHLKVINWGFLVKIDPSFVITENLYTIKNYGVNSSARVSVEKIKTALLDKKIIGTTEYNRLIAKYESWECQ